jgi:O-antigen/teichoic acid export membrane protein
MENETVRRVTKNAAFRFIGNVLSVLLAFFSSVLVARILGRNDYGILSITLTILNTALLFSDLGVSQTTTYFIPKLGKDKAKLKYFLSKMLSIKILITIFTAFLIFIFSENIAVFFKIEELRYVLKIFSFTFILYALFNYFYSVFQGFENIKYCMYQDIALSIAKFIPLIFVLIIADKLSGATIGYLLLYTFVLFFTLLLFFKAHYITGIKEKKFFSDEIKKYAFFTFTFLILAFIISNSITLFLGYFKNPAEVSYFTISQTIGSAINFVPAALSYALFPSISRLLEEKKKRELQNALNKIIRYCIIISIPASLVIFMLSKSIILFVYGSDFVLADNALKVTAIAFLIIGSTNWLNALFAGYGKMKLLSKILSILALITILSSLLLIPLFASVGASLVLVINEITFMLLSYYLLIKPEKLRIDKKIIIKSIISTISMLFLLVPIHRCFFGIMEFIVTILICIPFYFSLLYLIKGISKDDVLLFLNVLGFDRIKSILTKH